MNSITLNLNKHLAELLLFTSRIGTAIRLNSTYGEALNPADITWLSETLTKFGSLALAIRKDDLPTAGSEAKKLIIELNGFQKGEAKPILGADSLSTFNDLSSRGILKLDWAIAVLERIVQETEV